MIGYVTLGCDDPQKHAPLYDAIAKEMGVGRMMDYGSFIAWGEWGGGCGVALTKPFNGEPASVGNGVMVAIEAQDPAQVRRIYEIAMAHGGSDEGAPGPRGDADASGNVFYAAYFRDTFGNKLNAFCMAPAE
jgi:hypothetical protein